MKTIRIVCMLLCFSSVSLFGVIEIIGEKFSDELEGDLQSLHKSTSTSNLKSVPDVSEKKLSELCIAKIDRLNSDPFYFFFDTNKDVEMLVRVVLQKRGGKRIHWYSINMDEIYKRELKELTTIYKEKQKGMQ